LGSFALEPQDNASDHLRSEFTQSIGKRLTRRGDDMRAAQQRDLDGSESRHGSASIHHKGLTGGQR
jgi:hypothetical protein